MIWEDCYGRDVSGEANRLVCRWDGETLIVEPWGRNGLQVRSPLLQEPEDTDYALCPAGGRGGWV